MSAAREPIAWVLNLDAEHELEAGRGWRPTTHLERIVRRERRRLFGNLVAPGDVVLGEGDDGAARGMVGLAWSPTRSAIARLEAAGTRIAGAVDEETLARVNARPFAMALRAALLADDDGAPSFTKHLATDIEGALARIADPGREAPDGWLVRRTFGAAGRGRRRIGPREVSDADRAWLAASLRRGPLVLEPFVRVTREFTRSGWVREDGSVHVSQPCYQATDRSGAWLETAEARDGITREEDRRLGEAVAAAGAALASAGYRGPFGIDAFRHEDPRGGSGERLNPLSEINARFTMDWALAMPSRPERAR
ncbi:MAG TPA: hypothetical protein ENJ09_04135 [Planctomycetes bacterium]|nr:hypothetical protein [Planctomycetota bacterium]